MAAGGREEGLLAVARQTRRRINYLLQKPFVDEAELYGLAKGFFKAYVGKESELTAHELKRELHKVYLTSKVRSGLDAFLAKIEVLEYADARYSQEELKHLLGELDSLVREMVSEHQRQLPWLTRIAHFLLGNRGEKQEGVVISDYPALEENDPVTVELNTLLESFYEALDGGKRGRALKAYRLLLRKYEALGASAQQAFYHKLRAAYEALLRDGGGAE